MSLTTIEHKGNAAAGGAALAATAGLAWGSMFPVAKHGLRHVGAFHMTSIRYTLASLAFVALLAAREGRAAIRFDGRGMRLLVLGSLGFAGFNLLTYVGLGSTRPQNAALMIATMPFLTLLVLWIRNGARVVTSRSRPRLLLHRATLGEDGEPRVDGLPWQSAEVAHRVRDATMLDATLVRDDTLDRFDVLPLLVITDGALAAFGRDSRRLRPNLIVGGVAGLAERTWPGRVLAIGSVRIRLVTRRRRCIMTTFDPETAAQDPEVLLDIHQRFGGELALDAEVLEPGSIAVGDRACLE